MSDYLFSGAAADAASFSPLSLAFLGDTVFDLLVRGELLCEANRPVRDLHTLAAGRVCAAAQAAGAQAILPLLTEAEADVFRRGRNAHPGGLPKHASARDYHYATGLECLFGWLYLQGCTARIRQLYDEIRRAAEA